MSADANGKRWRETSLLPVPSEMRIEGGDVWIVVRPASLGATCISWDDAVERGWLEPVPWPESGVFA